MVPPVPTPLTRMSMVPPVARQISSAVVLRWTSGFAGFLNCCGMNAFGSPPSSWKIFTASLTAPFMPSSRGVSTNFAPNAFSNRWRSSDMLSGMVTVILYPRAAAVNASPIPVFPLVGSTIIVFGVSFPAFSAASIIATPMRSFTDHSGLKFSSFPMTVAFASPTTRRSRMQGVLPKVCVMSSKTCPRKVSVDMRGFLRRKSQYSDSGCGLAESLSTARRADK